MQTICACGTHADHLTRLVDCEDCGSACCRSCQVDVDHHVYCRWCAAALIAA